MRVTVIGVTPMGLTLNLLDPWNGLAYVSTSTHRRVLYGEIYGFN